MQSYTNEDGFIKASFKLNGVLRNPWDLLGICEEVVWNRFELWSMGVGAGCGRGGGKVLCLPLVRFCQLTSN